MNAYTLQTAKNHALREYPKESCGLVVVVKGKETYRPCRNIDDRPEEGFKMSAEDFAEAQEQGEIVAMVHSHPKCGPKPSPLDLMQCEEYQVPWYIVAVNTVNGERACDVSSFEPSGYEPPLVGRPYHFGVLDCFSLCRDWYRRERAIVLPNIEREPYWWVKGQNLYLDNFERMGFEVVVQKKGAKIDLSSVQIGDGLLMQIRSDVPNHAAIYIGDGMILHHPMDRLSTRDHVNGFYQGVTTHILRYKR